MLYLSLGTNLGNRTHNLQQASQLIAQRIGPIIQAATPIETAPVGFDSDNQFLNTALAVDTSLSATEVLRTTSTTTALSTSICSCSTISCCAAMLSRCPIPN